jgi:23S rRNA (adenine2503-C2)-methyltransferase
MEYKLEKSKDGTIKINFLEGYSSVIIPTKDEKKTVCVSCQIGCCVGCKFCYSGKVKFKRNLTTEEIIKQVEVAQKIIGKRPQSVVFMGMGEPLLNLSNILKAAEAIHNKFSIARYRITISTSALNNLNKLSKVNFNLAISLHSPFDSIRKKLIPSTISINRIVKFVDSFCKTHKKRFGVMIAYTLIKGVNDSEKDLRKLLSYKWHKRILFNLVEFNDILSFKKSDDKTIEEFKLGIINKGYKCFIRTARGRDVKASCGMLEG